MTARVREAFELLEHIEQLDARFSDARDLLARRGDRATESGWLASAQEHLARARAGADEVLGRALRLPELEAPRAERGRALQSAAVDALEALDARIRSEVGERSPVLEALYRGLKLPLARRYDVAAFERLCGEFDKRLGSSYVARMLADEAYASVRPAHEALTGAFEAWRTLVSGAPLTDAEADALRGEVEALAERVELPYRQARLLVEAALLAEPALLEASRLLERPRRRAAR